MVGADVMSVLPSPGHYPAGPQAFIGDDMSLIARIRDAPDDSTLQHVAFDAARVVDGAEPRRDPFWSGRRVYFPTTDHWVGHFSDSSAAARRDRLHPSDRVQRTHQDGLSLRPGRRPTITPADDRSRSPATDLDQVFEQGEAEPARARRRT